MTTAPPSLDDRYGRTRQLGVDKRLGWGIAIGALLLGLVVVLFGGWQSNNTVEGKVRHYEVQDPRTVAIDFQVSAPAQTKVACALEALSESYSTVGWKVIVLPPSAQLLGGAAGLSRSGRCTEPPGRISASPGHAGA